MSIARFHQDEFERVEPDLLRVERCIFTRQLSSLLCTAFAFVLHARVRR